MSQLNSCLRQGSPTPHMLKSIVRESEQLESAISQLVALLNPLQFGTNQIFWSSAYWTNHRQCSSGVSTMTWIFLIWRDTSSPLRGNSVLKNCPMAKRYLPGQRGITTMSGQPPTGSCGLIIYFM